MNNLPKSRIFILPISNILVFAFSVWATQNGDKKGSGSSCRTLLGDGSDVTNRK